MARRPRRPRVLVVTPVFAPARGGIETLTEHIVRGLAPWDVCVVTLREPSSTEWDVDSGLEIHRATNEPRGGRRSLLRLSVLTVSRGLRFRPTVVLSMYTRCSYGVYALCALTGVRWVQYYHAKEVPIFPRSARWAARHADAHVAVSQYTAGLVRAIGAPGGRLTVIPPAAPTEVRVSRRPTSAATPPTLVTVSRLDDAYKGHDVMLEAMRDVLAVLPTARWRIAGTGSLRPALERRVEELGLGDAVEFLGAISDEERDELLTTGDVFVLPSRVPDDGRGGEGFGIVYVEAAAAGLPVVAGHAGGAVDAVEDADAVPDGGTGLLVDPSDPHAVATAVVRLMTDVALQERVRSRGPRWADRFTKARLVSRLRPVLDPEATEDAQGLA